MAEARTQSEIRLAAGMLGWRLWRNNVGVLLDKNGRPIRYGLANETPAMNRTWASGDLIGWRPVFINEALLGVTIAQFVSVEAKAGEAEVRRAPQAQKNWMNLVNEAGGYATITHRI